MPGTGIHVSVMRHVAKALKEHGYAPSDSERVNPRWTSPGWAGSWPSTTISRRWARTVLRSLKEARWAVPLSFAAGTHFCLGAAPLTARQVGRFTVIWQKRRAQ